MIPDRFIPLPRRHGLAMALALILSGNTHATESDQQRISELEKKLAQSLTLVEQLSARVAHLEAVAAPGTAPPAPSTPAPELTAAQDERIAALEQTIGEIAADAVDRNELGLPLHGFADVGFSSFSNDNDGQRDGFALGTLSFYMTPQFGDRMRSIIELAFEYLPDGELATDLERVQFGYTFSDAATLWAGRFHTAYGYWNTAFHHGQQIQTAIQRPRFINFEDLGGILPAHMVGLQLSGTMDAGEGDLQYDAYLGNGNSVVDGVLDFNPVRDNDSNKMIGGNLRYRFGGVADGLLLGVHGMTQQVINRDNDNRTRLNMLGGFGVFDHENWEVIGEYYHFNNKDLSGTSGRHSSWAGFAQAGYRIDAWTPYARVEKTRLEQDDHYFADQVNGRSYLRNAFGLRYDVNPLSALKFEWSHTRIDLPGANQTSDDARINYSVRF